MPKGICQRRRSGLQKQHLGVVFGHANSRSKSPFLGCLRCTDSKISATAASRRIGKSFLFRTTRTTGTWPRIPSEISRSSISAGDREQSICCLSAYFYALSTLRLPQCFQLVCPMPPKPPPANYSPSWSDAKTMRSPNSMTWKISFERCCEASISKWRKSSWSDPANPGKGRQDVTLNSAPGRSDCMNRVDFHGLDDGDRWKTLS